METALLPSPWFGLDELRPSLHEYLRRHCRDLSELDDVLQETLLRAARYRGSLSDARNLRGWAQRIALNVLRDRARRVRRHRHVEGSDEGLDSVEGHESIPGEIGEDLQLRVGRLVVDRRVALSELVLAFDELKPADRAVLRSFYQGEQSSAQTAGECDIPLGLVKVRLFRARKRLLRALRRRIAALPESHREWPAACGDGLAGVA